MVESFLLEKNSEGFWSVVANVMGRIKVVPFSFVPARDKSVDVSGSEGTPPAGLQEHAVMDGAGEGVWIGVVFNNFCSNHEVETSPA